MKAKLTPYYIELVYDACLKSFWRRKSLAKFLKQCGVSERFLSTWSNDETKRDLLDRLFEKLPRNDSGRRAIIKISRCLQEQKSFPDLHNWEDSEVKIENAANSVQRLRIHQKEQEEQIKENEDKAKTQERFKEHQRQAIESQQSLEKLNDRLTELGTQLGSQKAGYDFQDWFYDLAGFSEVQNKKPYKHRGREIDGSITVSGTTYLVELKFTSEQAGSPDIDSFYKKVTSKADNTMGVMVSISGYSSIAKQEASGERTPLGFSRFPRHIIGYN